MQQLITSVLLILAWCLVLVWALNPIVSSTDPIDSIRLLILVFTCGVGIAAVVNHIYPRGG